MLNDISGLKIRLRVNKPPPSGGRWMIIKQVFFIAVGENLEQKQKHQSPQSTLLLHLTNEHEQNIFHHNLRLYLRLPKDGAARISLLQYFSNHLVPQPGIELTGVELPLREGPLKDAPPTELHGHDKHGQNIVK